MSSTSKLTTESLSVDFDTLQLPGIELHQLMDDLRAQAPVVPVTFLGERVWLITDHAHVAAGFRDNNIFPPHTPYKIGIEPVIGETFQSMAAVPRCNTEVDRMQGTIDEVLNLEMVDAQLVNTLHTPHYRDTSHGSRLDDQL